MQRDPNATAASLLSMSSTGRGFAAMSFSMEDLYGDGMNLYEYLGSNPWQRNDPLGLSWDPFSIVDDFLAERAGGSAALLSALGQETKAAAVVAATIASYLPFPFVGNLGELALFALGETSEGELAVAMALGVVPGGKLAHMFAKSGLGSFIGKIGSSAWKSAKHYAGKAGSALGRGAGGLVDRARQFMGRKPPGSCCFTAGTVVWTIFGLVPIEQVDVGDLVFTLDEATGAMVLGTVIDQFETEGAALLELTVRHESGRLETIETTDEHPFWREAGENSVEGWVRADGLTPGDRVRTLSGAAVVETARFGSDRTTVYNLSISTDPSFLIGDDGVWVHNCSKFTPRNFKLAGQKHPKTNVPFDSMGYPDFSDWSIATRQLPGGHQGRRLDEIEANRLAGFSETPEGYVWHHHQDGTTMQLVDRLIHEKTGHTGSIPGR
ncbi:MAG: HNH endonuclease [Phycisphaeraceae bacterium]|nr:HNH endonuclease [Phycisphaeraceae bacterium]